MDPVDCVYPLFWASTLGSLSLPFIVQGQGVAMARLFLFACARGLHRHTNLTVTACSVVDLLCSPFPTLLRPFPFPPSCFPDAPFMCLVGCFFGGHDSWACPLVYWLCFNHYMHIPSMRLYAFRFVLFINVLFIIHYFYYCFYLFFLFNLIYILVFNFYYLFISYSYFKRNLINHLFFLDL